MSTMDHVKKFLTEASEKELDRLSEFLLKRRDKRRGPEEVKEDVDTTDIHRPSPAIDT